MQIVENWSTITCKTVRSETGDGWVSVHVVVEQSESVAGFPNLIAAGPSIVALRLKGQFDRQALSGSFKIKARRAGTNIIWGEASTLQPVR